jgi:hypothetical protein
MPVANRQRDKVNQPRFAQFAVKSHKSPCFQPAECNIAGLNTTQRISHRNPSAFFTTTSPSKICVPPHDHKTSTLPGTQPPFSPSVIVTNSPEKQTIQVTFASTGPPTSSFAAKYSIVQQGAETNTTRVTDISVSTGLNSGPRTGIKLSKTHRDSVSGQDEDRVQANT